MTPKGTQTIIFFLLTILSVLSIISIYFVLSFTSNRSFLQYKQKYFAEQTYHISYILRTNIETPLTSEKNKELFDKTAQEFATPVHFFNEDFSKIIYTNEMNHTEFAQPFYIDVPIVKEGEPLGYLRAFYDLDQHIGAPALSMFEKNSQNQLRMIIVIALVVTIIINFFLSRILAKPIKQSAYYALKVLRGNREEFVPRNGTEEIKQLIDGINSLLVEFNNVENWRKQMMEDLTHELRTPLTSVLTRLEAIIDGVYPTTTKNLQDIYDEMERLSRLVANVQRLSEAEGARFKLNIEKVNMVHLVKGVYEGFLFIAKQKEIELNFRNPNKPCTAYVDPDRMIQVVTNIISNALKYTARAGKVEIGIESNDDELIIYCKDNGVGIHEDELSLIFNRFYRTDKSRSREYGGSGIGLSISKALVHAHGGEIGVESEPGEGSKFWVGIPIDNQLVSPEK